MNKAMLCGVLVLSFVGCGGNKSAPASEVPETPSDVSAAPETVVEAPAEDTAATEGDVVAGEGACTTDADCVPSACCHAPTCVSKDNAPSCDEVMCTKECRLGTLDCGGSCLCQDGKCAARVSAQPAM